MAIAHARVAVGTSATLIRQARSGDPSGVSLLIQNPDSAVTVYFGADSVTTTSYGFALGPSQVLGLSLDPGESLHAVVSSGSVTVNVLVQGE